MKTMGIILSSTYDDSTLGELTNKRTVASLPFGGRYRQIDFILSNLSNSGIYNIGLITKYNYQSLMDHLGTCEEWDLNRKNEGLRIIPPFASENRGVYRGKMEALSNAYSFINNPAYEYVVIAESSVLFSLDFRPVVEQHAKSGADVTMLAAPGDGTGRRVPLAAAVSEAEPGSFEPQADCRERILPVTDLRVNAAAGEQEYGGMGVFIIGREFLAENVRDAAEHGYVDFERDFIQRKFNAGELKLAVCPFQGVVLRNDSIESFYQNNLALLNEKTRKGLFKFYRPVYTRIRNEAPTYYRKGSSAADSMIADGCTISGRVEHSVIFRNTAVGAGACVRNSVIMHGASIGENAELDCVILDRDVRIRDGVTLKGAPGHPVVIEKGAVI